MIFCKKHKEHTQFICASNLNETLKCVKWRTECLSCLCCGNTGFYGYETRSILKSSFWISKFRRNKIKAEILTFWDIFFKNANFFRLFFFKAHCIISIFQPAEIFNAFVMKNVWNKGLVIYAKAVHSRR